MRSTPGRPAQRGSSLIEFVIVAFTLLLIVFASIEFDRMVLVYTTLVNSAKTGVRYAIVHGTNRAGGTGADGQSGATDTSQVETVIRNFAGAGLLDTSKLVIAVTYPASTSVTDPGNNIGSAVVITVTYPYDPWTVLPLHVNLRSAAQGVIVY